MRSFHLTGVLFTAAFLLSGCGGTRADSPYQQTVEGHWIGTLHMVEGSWLGSEPQEASHVLEVRGDTVYLRFAPDQEPWTGTVLNNEGEAPSFTAAPQGQNCGFHGSCATITYSDIQDGRAQVEYSRMEVIYGARWTGEMRRLTPDPAVQGIWRGSLTLRSDSCESGVNNLAEVHVVQLEGDDVTLTSTDGRTLLGITSSDTSFAVSASYDGATVRDSVEYRDIDSGYAFVTVTHSGRRGNSECTASWSGPMLRDNS